jgi:hypothetical protein
MLHDQEIFFKLETHFKKLSSMSKNDPAWPCSNASLLKDSSTNCSTVTTDFRPFPAALISTHPGHTPTIGDFRRKARQTHEMSRLPGLPIVDGAADRAAHVSRLNFSPEATLYSSKKHLSLPECSNSVKKIIHYTTYGLLKLKMPHRVHKSMAQRTISHQIGQLFTFWTFGGVT